MALRQGKGGKIRKDPGLPHFGDEKKKLEQRVSILFFIIYIVKIFERKIEKFNGNGN